MHRRFELASLTATAQARRFCASEKKITSKPLCLKELAYQSNINSSALSGCSCTTGECASHGNAVQFCF